MYLDTDNNLVYRIIDHEGESHIIKVPEKIHTFRAESVYYLLLEYGFSETYSFMRLFINDKEVARNQMDYKLNLPLEVKPDEMVIAADIKKTNFGKFTLSFLSILKGTLTREQRESLFGATIKFHEAVRK